LIWAVVSGGYSFNTNLLARSACPLARSRCKYGLKFLVLSYKLAITGKERKKKGEFIIFCVRHELLCCRLVGNQMDRSLLRGIARRFCQARVFGRRLCLQLGHCPIRLL